MHVQNIQKQPFLDLGKTASMRARNKNTTPLKVPSKFSDTWHIDIGYGPCTSIGGFKYVLIAIDKHSHYKLCYGLKNLTSSSLSAIKQLVRDVGVKLGTIRTNFDTKLMAGEVEKYLIDKKINLESAPPYCQHQNGLVEQNVSQLSR